MKLTKKIMLISAATLLSLSPVAQVMSTPGQEVIAAKRDKVGSLKLRFDANQYFHDGYLNWKAGILKKGRIIKRYGQPIRIGKGHYYRIGRNRYISVSNVGQIDGKKTLILDHNASVYNNRGQRLKKRVIEGDTPLIFYNTKTIKNSKYYRIGKNRYVKAANVGAINGKTAYANQSYVTVKGKAINSYTLDGYANDDTYKKGQRIPVDQYIYIPASYSDDFTAANDDSAVAFYHIKGRKNAYLCELDVTPRKAMKLLDYEDLHNTYIKYTVTGDMPIYDANGQATKVIVPDAATNAYNVTNVDRLQYIWVASENKAELFYHLRSAYVNAPKGDVYRLGDIRKYVGNGFVKASDAKYSSGIKLKPINTPAEAQADGKVATAADKTNLNQEISRENAIKNSEAYKLTTRGNRESYDQALKDAQAVANSNTATIAQVKITVWRLQQCTKNLDGAKVHVKNLDHLTEADAVKIYQVAYNANNVYTPEYNYLINISFHNHNRQLVLNLRHYSKATQDPQYLLSNTTKELNIADYATDK